MFFYFSEETDLEITCKLSARQMIHMKCQYLLYLKNKKDEILECTLLQILLGALIHFSLETPSRPSSDAASDQGLHSLHQLQEFL